MKLRELRHIAADAARQILEAPLYSAGIVLYRLGVSLAGLFNAKAGKLDRGQGEIYNRIRPKIKRGDRVVWLHAASLGEFEQGRPLIELIKQRHPEYKILLTFFSPSGYEVRKNYPLADCVCYLPFDTPLRVAKFINTVNPEKAIFIKYEIWRNYLEALNDHNVPTYLVSAAFRPEQKFFKRRFAWYGMWLRWYTRLFVQDERSRRLLAGIGIENVDVTGDTRFDRVSNIRENRKAIPELAHFTGEGEKDRPLVFMAGSSWPADEDVYVPWINAHPEVKAVVAPHEFNESRLNRLRERFDGGAVLYSELYSNPEAGTGVQVLIMDCFGMLSSAYGYCDIAYVGGGFGVGIHNINEPAVYGVPVLYGPNHQKFIEAREMAETGGGIPMTNAGDFRKAMDMLTSDTEERLTRGRKAEEYIVSKLGATEKVYRAIFPE